jgi:hypothetical protein
LRLVEIIEAGTDVGDEFRQSSFYHSHMGNELRGQGCPARTMSSCEEYLFEDTDCSYPYEANDVEFHLLNEEVDSVFSETRTSPSGFSFNVNTLTRSSHSSTAGPNFLNTSINNSPVSVKDYVVG